MTMKRMTNLIRVNTTKTTRTKRRLVERQQMSKRFGLGTSTCHTHPLFQITLSLRTHASLSYGVPSEGRALTDGKQVLQVSIHFDFEYLRRPFRSPLPDAPACTKELQRRVAAKRQFVPWSQACANGAPR